MANKDTKNIKSALTKARVDQAAKRATDVDIAQDINPDVTNDNYLGLYSKAMPHTEAGIVASENNIRELQIALETGKQEDFNSIEIAGGRLASPQGAISLTLSGADPEGVTMKAPDALNGIETAAEMIEVYAKAYCRDIPWLEYAGGGAEDARIVAALDALNNDPEVLAAFLGPKIGGVVTRKTLFRGVAPGCVIGPYISQLLMHPIGVGNYTYEPVGKSDDGEYGITDADYQAIQEGNPNGTQARGATDNYQYNGRQIGSTVHVDLVFQHFYEGSAILLNAGVKRQPAFDSLLSTNTKEGGFLTLGGPVELTTAVADVARHALKAAWVQKWRKHMRLRPEACAARVVAEKALILADGTVHPKLKNSAIIGLIETDNAGNGGENKAYLPLQYVEGSPTHPSYPAGHAAISGACATIMKIYLADGTWDAPTSLGGSGLSVLEATSTGAATQPYGNADNDQSLMTIHGEINKLAANVSIGRNIAGVHYRIDGDEGMMLGQKVAVQWYKDQKALQNEDIGDITFVGFDGVEVTV